MSIRILTTELFAEAGGARRRDGIKKSGLHPTPSRASFAVEIGDSPVANLDPVKEADGNEQPVLTTPQAPAIRP